MIFRHKPTGVVVQNAILVSDIQGKHFRYANTSPITLHLSREESERLYTEEEHQAGIEAAVKEYKNRVAELEESQKPLAVTQEFAKVIEEYKDMYGPSVWEGQIIYHFHIDPRISQSSVFGQYGHDLALVIKNGYIVKDDLKTDVLTENFRSIINDHADTKVNMDVLIEEMAAYVRDNYEAKE